VIACKNVAAKKKRQNQCLAENSSIWKNKKEKPGKKYIEIMVGTLPTQYVKMYQNATAI